MLSSVPMPILDEHPAVSIKKPTRQWDAWTRQEEENFFNALRQVGKNFEKITCRVQSKNKDQVRHYYYRVIKRMNKLLGPGLVLDARNSKDANTAMLSWWSLLEKHSCSASKLHLKPRRFKTFVTALEHQLLKDRKKTRRKKVPSVESLFIQPSSVGTAVNVSVIGSESVKLCVRGETQTTRKIGAQRGSPAKRKSTPRKSPTSAEGTRPPRQRRKVSDVSVSLAAFKRWEKAASAGVTLMAEAAEHLEKAAAVEQMERLEAIEPHILQTTQVSSSACDVKCRTNQHLSGINICASNVPSNIAPKDGPVTKDDNSTRLVNSRKFGDMKGVSDVDSNLCTGLPVSFQARTMAVPSCDLLPSSSTFTSGGLKVVPMLPCNGVAEIPSNIKKCRDPNCQTGGQKHENTPSKLKLQLFPIDVFTRQTLEQDGLNPHLELTLKGRKSIASILQHLISKWGKSSIAAGELRLFPFDAECVDAASCESWNFKDVAITAADVHKMIGSPVIFRLRYGWLSSRVLQTSSAVLQEEHPLSSAIIDLNASLNLDDGKAFMPVTTLQSGFSIEKNPVESNKFYLCDVAEVQKDVPSCLEQVSPRPVAGLANCAASSLTLDTMEHDGDYRTSIMLQGDTKENTPEIGMHVNKLLAQNDDGCQKTFTPSAVVSFGPVPGVNGIRTEFVDTQVTSLSWLYEGSNDGFAQCLWSDEDPLRSNGAVILPSEVDWVDSFTNISIGELLNQVSHADSSTIKCEPLHFSEKSDLPPSLESLKAVQPQRFTTEALVLSAQTQQQSSIWGAEDACDSFSFQRVRFPGSVVDASSLDKASTNLTLLGGHSEAFSSVPWRQAKSKEKVISEKQMQEISNPLTKDVDDLGASHVMPLELYLADSLGALDMGMNHQSEGHQGQDLFLNGDSSLGFGGLIGVLGQGNMDSLLGLPNQNESNSMYREEKHSPFLLSESSNKEQVYQSQP